AAKSAKPDEFGFAAESVGEFFGREPERHVHLRTRFALRSPDVKPVALVDRIVKDIGFRRVSCFHYVEPALPRKPITDKPDHINSPGVRRIYHRTFFCKPAKIENSRQRPSGVDR